MLVSKRRFRETKQWHMYPSFHARTLGKSSQKSPTREFKYSQRRFSSNLLLFSISNNFFVFSKLFKQKRRYPFTKVVLSPICICRAFCSANLAHNMGSLYIRWQLHYNVLNVFCLTLLSLTCLYFTDKISNRFVAIVIEISCYTLHKKKRLHWDK